MIARAETAQKESHGNFGEKRKATLLRLQAERARQTGQVAEAMARCEDVLKLDPLDGRTLLVLAQLQQDAGFMEDAAMTCERATRVKGCEAEALVRQAQIEVRRERYGRAAELLENAQVFQNQPHVERYLEQVRRLAAMEDMPGAASGNGWMDKAKTRR